ncbi:MAG: TetR/AcrR family transcriptional regulator [Acidimicrobiales bacterium]
MDQVVTSRAPRRADAQRNYDAILAAARAAVDERGGDIVLEDIARQAGVGIGTLYRHFPTRQSLLEAVFLDVALDLRDRAEELMDAPDALDALVKWLRLQLEFSAHGKRMGAAVMAAKHIDGSDLQVAYESMKTYGAVLLRRAQDAGEVRDGVDLVDVLKLLYGIVMACEQVPDQVRIDRMFDVVIAGITL